MNPSTEPTQNHLSADVQVPDGFPWSMEPGSLPEMPRTVVPMTPQERQARYLLCQGLVEKYLAHHEQHQKSQKHQQNRKGRRRMTVEQLIEDFYFDAVCGEWVTTVAENLWIVKQLRTKLAPPDQG